MLRWIDGAIQDNGGPSLRGSFWVDRTGDFFALLVDGFGAPPRLAGDSVRYYGTQVLRTWGEPPGSMNFLIKRFQS